MRLYGSLTSPYVRKARVLLREKNIACEFIVSNPGDADSVVPQYNPLGKVPVLELDDGGTLFDSPVILEYLDARQGEPLIPASGPSRWQVLRWQALADGILDAVVARVLETRRPEAQRSPQVMTHQAGKVARALAFADKTGEGKRYLVEGRLSLADLTMGVALGYIDFRYPHDWRSQHRRLAEWFAAMSARPAFTETQPPAA
jgi:glutathione S-transferase